MRMKGEEGEREEGGIERDKERDKKSREEGGGRERGREG